MKAAVRKLTKIFLCLLTLSVLLGLGTYLFLQNHVFLNGKPYRRDVRELSFFGESLPDLDTLAQLKNLHKLDLRNTELSLGEHEWLARQLPDCQILWQVLFQNRYYFPDEDRITVESLTDSDVILLDYLPELREVDARKCRDYGPLAELIRRKPQCRVLCSVQLGENVFDQDTERMTLQDPAMPEVMAAVSVLPALKRIEFTGKLPATEDINKLRRAYPSLQIGWQAEICGRVYPETQEILDLSLKTVEDGKQLKEQLLYFPYLKTLDFRGVRMEQKDRKLLETYYPQVEMIWDYDLDGVKAPVDTKILDLSGHSQVTLQEIEEALPYLPELQKIILCDCGLPNEELSAFNKKRNDIRVVWNVQVGGRNTRTDEKYFAPNKWGLKMDDENIYDLRYCTDMVCVDIGHSKKVTNCEWAAFMPELRFLILADSSVRGLEPLENLRNLQFLELFLIPGQDLSPLKGCTSLEDLNLCYVYADPAPIQEMTWLKRLWWSGCWPARNLLSGTMPNTEMNFDTGSSTGEGWREGRLYYEMRDFIGMGYMKG